MNHPTSIDEIETRLHFMGRAIDRMRVATERRGRPPLTRNGQQVLSTDAQCWLQLPTPCWRVLQPTIELLAQVSQLRVEVTIPYWADPNNVTVSFVADGEIGRKLRTVEG